MKTILSLNGETFISNFNDGKTGKSYMERGQEQDGDEKVWGESCSGCRTLSKGGTFRKKQVKKSLEK